METAPRQKVGGGEGIMAKEAERKYAEKARNQTIKELEALHKRVAELEKSSSEIGSIDATLLKRKLVRSAAIDARWCYAGRYRWQSGLYQ